jgi:hypothetical protein
MAMQALTKVLASTILVLCLFMTGCSGGMTQTQQTTMKGGMVGSVGGVALGAIGGNAALGMTVGRVAGMGVGYIYGKNQEGSD